MSADDVAILGLGASGDAAARLALSKGKTVYVSETSTHARTAARAARLGELGAVVELGTHDLARIAEAELVVVSPGIPPDAPVLRELRHRGVPWISEPEFAVRFYQGSLIAVTGTNGKTTTAALTAHLLEQAGIQAALGGNVGAGLAPAASELALREVPPTWYVLEVSSFQLADTVTFSPDIGVVTNLAADHLDRYPDTAAYYADKARLFERARSSSRWVLNGDDPEVMRLPGDAPGVRHYFRWESGPEATASACVDGGVLTLRLSDPPGGDGPSEEALLPVGSLRLLGRHNVMNALAASLTARLAGAHPDGIREGLRTFLPLPHRLEPVLERDGVLWVNDSKATNVSAAAGAVESLARPLVVLLGGKDKGEDFRPLAAALRGRARAVILHGEAAGRLERELLEGWEEAEPAKPPADSPRAGGESRAGSGSASPARLPEPPLHLRVPGGLDQAVEEARRLAHPGDVILLAPACSSYDAFENYEARGERFRALALSREAP